MPYLDGLPAASAVSVNDLIAIDQGGTAGRPGTATTRKATISQFLGSVPGNTYLPLIGGTVTGLTTFSGSGTGLAVTNNVTIGGTMSVGGLAHFGTGTFEASPHAFQAAYNADPSVGAPHDTRQSMFNSTLSYANNTTTIWENLNSFVTVNGPGIATGEINLAHTYLQVNANAHVVVAEGYESSVVNKGIMGSYSGGLAIFQNDAGATASGVGGFFTYLTNNNATPGSITEWDGIGIGMMQGSGSRPTFYNAIRIADPYAGIVTLGGMNIGSLGNADPRSFALQGADNSSGTIPFVLRNLAGATSLFTTNAGSVTFPVAGVALGTSSINLLVTGLDNSSGTLPVVVKNLAGTTLAYVTNAGGVNFGVAGVAFGIASVNLFVQGADNSSGTVPFSVKNLAGTNVVYVTNAGGAVIGTSLSVPLISGPTNLTLGTGAALATNATAGMILIPTFAGTPTGNVGALGAAALGWDSAASKLWVGVAGTWKSVTLT